MARRDTVGEVAFREHLFGERDGRRLLDEDAERERGEGVDSRGSSLQHRAPPSLLKNLRGACPEGIVTPTENKRFKTVLRRAFRALDSHPRPADPGFTR